MVFQSSPSSGALICAGWRLLLSMLCAGALTACSSLLIYYPSDKYDNKVVRGVVTHIATKEEMAENWERKARSLPDAPSKLDYITGYSRVVVSVDRGLGSGTFVYPFIPPNLRVSVGDVVDVPVDVYSEKSGLFSGRLVVSRVACRALDKKCLEAEEGSHRGVVGGEIRQSYQPPVLSK